MFVYKVCNVSGIDSGWRTAPKAIKIPKSYAVVKLLDTILFYHNHMSQKYDLEDNYELIILYREWYTKKQLLDKFNILVELSCFYFF